MSEQTINLGELVEALAARINAVPLSVDLWGPDEVGKYLKVSSRHVSERLACRPDFPKVIRLPSESGRGVKRWKAQEVINWAEGLRQNSAKRA